MVYDIIDSEVANSRRCVHLTADRPDRRLRTAREWAVGRVHRVGAVGDVPRGLRIPAESVLNNVYQFEGDLYI